MRPERPADQLAARRRAWLCSSWLAVAACAPAAPKTASVTLHETATPPTETVALALPQTHVAPPPRHRARWTPPPPRSPPDVAAARVHFADGVRAWSASDFSRALSEFETAYAYSAHAAVLYNIGMALERVGREEEAIDVLERYAAAPGARLDEVRARIADLRSRHP